jgi:homoserine dehydrogenase
VAREFCALAERQREALRAAGLRLLVTAAGTRHASFLDSAGVTPGRLLELAADALPGAPQQASELMRRSDADIVIEATVMEDGGAPIAAGHIETAFRLGMDVITVNKGPVAWEFARLQALADQLGRRWRYEGTVADGMPVFNLLELCLRHCQLAGFDAIFNGTTNFIIEEVGKGTTFEEAIAVAQSQGIAEADPSHDIDGMDAACKTAALANAAMKAGITPNDIARDSIRGLTTGQVRAAAAAGRKLCVLCSASRRPEGGVTASVKLTEIPLSHPLAPIRGCSLGVVLHTDLMADVLVAEMNAYVPQTAYAVYADLLALRAATIWR